MFCKKYTNLIFARVAISAVVEVEVEAEGNSIYGGMITKRFITKISAVKVEWHISQEALQRSPSTFSHGLKSSVDSQASLNFLFSGIPQGYKHLIKNLSQYTHFIILWRYCITLCVSSAEKSTILGLTFLILVSRYNVRFAIKQIVKMEKSNYRYVK